MQRDSVAGTFTVAAVLCVVCSIIVSSAAVGLRPIQDQNKADFERKNILIAVGEIDENGMNAENEKVSRKEINEMFKDVINEKIIDLDTGEEAPSDVVSLKDYDQRAAAKDPAMSTKADGLTSIDRREKYSRVYEVVENDKVSKIVLPIYGKGLWSTLYGFIAIERDEDDKLNEVAGITFYQHGETPGLGGEVDNPNWKRSWKGKLIRDTNGDVKLAVVKGKGDSEFEVDGLSGATITSNGVTNTVQYWLSDDGFGKYLATIE